MPDHTLTQQQSQEIPYGYCQCGCGQLAPIAKVTRRKAGHVKGEPLRFIQGHGSTIRHALADPNPAGLCMCGCGQLTQIAKKTNLRNGHVAGCHVRFLPRHHNNVTQSLAARFWSKVDRRGPDECWLWTANHNSRGYGKIATEGGRAGRQEYAHRVAYELHYGPIPDAMLVCHRCDNPACCNPSHLFAGTATDNMQDMVAKDRGARGSRSGHAKLSEGDAIEILALLAAGIEQKEIGRRFGITQSAVSNIRRGVTWKHLCHSRERYERKDAGSEVHRDK